MRKHKRPRVSGGQHEGPAALLLTVTGPSLPSTSNAVPAFTITGPNKTAPLSAQLPAGSPSPALLQATSAPTAPAPRPRIASPQHQSQAHDTIAPSSTTQAARTLPTVPPAAGPTAPGSLPSNTGPRGQPSTAPAPSAGQPRRSSHKQCHVWVRGAAAPQPHIAPTLPTAARAITSTPATTTATVAPAAVALNRGPQPPLPATTAPPHTASVTTASQAAAAAAAAENLAALRRLQRQGRLPPSQLPPPRLPTPPTSLLSLPVAKSAPVGPGVPRPPRASAAPPQDTRRVWVRVTTPPQAPAGAPAAACPPPAAAPGPPGSAASSPGVSPDTTPNPTPTSSSAAVSASAPCVALDGGTNTLQTDTQADQVSKQQRFGGEPGAAAAHGDPHRVLLPVAMVANKLNISSSNINTGTAAGAAAAAGRVVAGRVVAAAACGTALAAGSAYLRPMRNKLVRKVVTGLGDSGGASPASRSEEGAGTGYGGGTGAAAAGAAAAARPTSSATCRPLTASSTQTSGESGGGGGGGGGSGECSGGGSAECSGGGGAGNRSRPDGRAAAAGAVLPHKASLDACATAAAAAARLGASGTPPDSSTAAVAASAALRARMAVAAVRTARGRGALVRARSRRPIGSFAAEAGMQLSGRPLRRGVLTWRLGAVGQDGLEASPSPSSGAPLAAELVDGSARAAADATTLSAAAHMAAAAVRQQALMHAGRLRAAPAQRSTPEPISLTGAGVGGAGGGGVVPVSKRAATCRLRYAGRGGVMSRGASVWRLETASLANTGNSPQHTARLGSSSGLTAAAITTTSGQQHLKPTATRRLGVTAASRLAVRRGVRSLKLIAVNGQQYYTVSSAGSLANGDAPRQIHSLASVAGKAAAAAAVAAALRRRMAEAAARRTPATPHVMKLAVWRRRGLGTTSPTSAAAVAAAARRRSLTVPVPTAGEAAAVKRSRSSLPYAMGAGRALAASAAAVAASSRAAAAQRILAKARMRAAAAKATATRGHCPDFCRMGVCKAASEPTSAGRCPHIHDPTKVAVCPRWLAGSCSEPSCPLQHRRLPDLMPLCSYFLQGKCTANDCPYLHKTYSPTARACRAFLHSFCPRGAGCPDLHLTAKMARERARMLGGGAAAMRAKEREVHNGPAGMVPLGSTGTGAGGMKGVVGSGPHGGGLDGDGAEGSEGTGGKRRAAGGTANVVAAVATYRVPKRRRGGFRYFNSLPDDGEEHFWLQPAAVASRNETSGRAKGVVGQVATAAVATEGEGGGEEHDYSRYGIGQGQGVLGEAAVDTAGTEHEGGGGPLILLGGMKLYL